VRIKFLFISLIVLILLTLAGCKEPNASISTPLTSSTTNNSSNKITSVLSPPSTGKIAFTILDKNSNTSQIYQMDGDGRNQLKLTALDIGEFPSWSPDGKKLIYSTSATSKASIVGINVDGTGKTSITNETADKWPSWSRDGKRIVFISYRDFKYNSSNEIYMMNADGSNQTRLTENDFLEAYPCLSPDNTKISFVSKTNDLWVMNVDGTNRVNLTNSGSNESNIFPVWSPDGKKIAFQRENSENNRNWQIWVMDADGSNQTKLTNILAKNVCPTWSPDGQMIAFISERDGGAREIYAMKADGSNQTRLTNNIGMINSLVWSP
jgi:Tol biopolymer transport system component